MTKIKTRSGAMVDVRVGDNVLAFGQIMGVKSIPYADEHDTEIGFGNGAFADATDCTLHSRPTFKVGDIVQGYSYSEEKWLPPVVLDSYRLTIVNLDLLTCLIRHADPDLREPE